MKSTIVDTLHVVKSKPEHASNLAMGSSYGVSIFLEHQYLVLMTVAYLFVTFYLVRGEVRELHHCPEGKHERR